MGDDLVRMHVRKLLEALLLDGSDEATRIAELEASGHRIVSGGQTDSYDESGKTSWVVTDWRTGEVLLKGRSSLQGMDEAIAGSDPDGTWYHIDHVIMGADPTEVVTEGIPRSLASALDDWIGMMSTTDEDVAEFVGWPVEKVRRCRSAN